MKKKTSKAKKDGTIGNVTDAPLNTSRMQDEFEKQVEQELLPIDLIDLETIRIVVAVVETATWSEGDVKKSKKLETGRAMAQACHAVSKLKLSYAMWLSQGDFTKCYRIVQRLMYHPITCIVVKARDASELMHIIALAGAKDMHYAAFNDDNVEFYKSKATPMTAVAIGPYYLERFNGITDYLPSWKSPDEL